VFDSNNPNIDITAPGTVTLHGQSFGDKVQIENYNATTHEWTIKFYKDGDESQCKTITIHGDVNTKVILDVMGQSSVIGGFIDHASLPETDTTKLASVQIGANGGSNGTSSTHNGPINPNHSDDSVPSRVDGDTATFDVDSDPTITNYFKDGAPTNYQITASGTVTINPSRQSDQFHVTTEYDSNGVLKYKIVATGVDENGQSHTVTYWVKADQVHKIVIANVDTSQVTFGDSSQITDDQKAKIQVGNDASTDTTNSTGQVPQMIQSLLDGIPGLTQDTLLAQVTQYLISAGSLPAGTSTLTMAQLKQKMDQGVFPPSGPDQHLIDFIRHIDPVFDNTLNSATTWDPNDLKIKYTHASNELVRILTVMYPGTQIHMDNPNGDWKSANDVDFGQMRFSYTNENQSHTQETQFQWC